MNVHIRYLLFYIIFLAAPSIHAADYTLPLDIGSGPFQDCSGFGPVYVCTDNITIGNNDLVFLMDNVTLVVEGNFDAGNGFMVFTSGFSFTLQVDGNVDLGNSLIFDGNIIATGNVDIGNNANFSGSIVADGNIDIGNNGNFFADITADGNLDIGNNTVVDGVCTPNHPQCTGGGGGGGGGGINCVTFRDEFSSESYSRQDGTANWSGNWIEMGDNGSASNGDIEISGGRLQLEGDGAGGGRPVFGGDPSIERQLDLSTYSSATLTFNYSETGDWENTDDIEVWLSTDGGTTWGASPLHRFTNDQGSTQQLFSRDITAFLSPDTRIALVEKASAGNEIFYFDNLQIEACTTGAPTVDALTTSDRTPTLTGTFNSADAAGGFTVQVDAVTYTLGSSVELTNVADSWTLDLSTSSPLALGFYDVIATSDDGAGNTLSDVTSDELNIIEPVCTTFFRDDFGVVSYASNNGEEDFSAPWDEFEGSSLINPEGSPNPASGHVRISGGQLSINNFSPESANMPGVERLVDLSPYSSATLSFRFTTSGNVDNDDSFLVQVSSNGGTSWTQLDNITGINDTTATRSYIITPYISANTKIRLRVNSTINSGDCCYGSNGETISFDYVNITVDGPCMDVDHYAIVHSGQGVTCEAEMIRIVAHDNVHVDAAPSATTTIRLTTDPAHDGLSLKAGNGIFTPPDEYTFDGSETFVEFWLRKTDETAAMDIDVTDGTASAPDNGGLEDQPLAFANSALKFSAIGTQIAGKPSGDLTLRAIRTDLETGACVARVTGLKTVQMLYDCDNPSDCWIQQDGVTITAIHKDDFGNITATPSTAINDDTQFDKDVEMDFDDSGEATFRLNYRDAGQLFLSASLALAEDEGAPGPAITLSANSLPFLSKPAGLCVTAPQANSTCASGDASCDGFKMAGEDFQLRVQAMTWEHDLEVNTDFCDNQVTPNFELSSLAISHTLVAPVLPLPGPYPGTISANTMDMVPADDGVTINQTVSEVGVFTFTVDPPDNAYFGETIPVSTSANVGRFYPDHFVLTKGSLTERSDLGCVPDSNFTYMGENLQLRYSISAHSGSLGNPITQNYSDTFAKLDSVGELNYAAADTVIPKSLLPPRLVTDPLLVIDFNEGVADIIDTVRLDRDPTGIADGPYEMRVGIAPDDGDTQLRPADLDLDVDIASNPGFDHGEVASGAGFSVIRFGRLVVSNSHSSELVPQTVNMRAQYYDDGSASFVGNTDDDCTPFDVVNIDLASPPSTYPGLVGPLAAGDLAATGAGLFSSGAASIVLHDGNPLNAGSGPGVVGDVIYEYDLVALPFLQFDWDGDGAHDNNPGAKATFGIFNGDSRQIYYRQIFR